MSIPYIPLYVADYEADTAHLSLEEDGAYLRLLRLCWRTPGCSVPADPKWIMRKMRVSADDYYRVVEPLIDEFFTRGLDRVFSARLQAESERINDTHKKRSDAGKRGNEKKRALKTNDKVSRPAHATRTITRTIKKEEEPIGSSMLNFSEFWDQYPRKVGKQATENAFKKACKRHSPEVVFSGLQCHRPSLEERHNAGKTGQQNFCPHPSTWLNQGRYLDPVAEAALSVAEQMQREAEGILSNGATQVSRAGGLDSERVGRLSPPVSNTATP